MSPATLTILTKIMVILGGIFALYGVYFIVIALFGLKKRPAAPASPPTSRFAVLIAARNEQMVIPQMIKSLKNQNYPDELYDIIIAPNNCTDDTCGEALRCGAQVFNPEGPISNKGHVLHQFIDGQFKEKGYDALIVFDADNLIHPDFLQRMNDARNAGYVMAQGFRDTKNLTESPVSTCYSVCYWMLNRFYNGGREALGLSSLINGCGFMATKEAFEKTGGWNTTTLTEDYEYSSIAVLQGICIRYVPEAVFYDEQPLTFSQSWKQRRRWSTGNVDGMRIHLWELIKHSITKRDMMTFDVAITYMLPLVQLVSTVVGTMATVLVLYRAFIMHLIRGPQAVLILLGVILLIFAFASIVAAFVVALTRGKLVQGTGKGIAYFAWFLITWAPIGIISMFKKKKTWDVITHTNTQSLSDIKHK